MLREILTNKQMYEAERLAFAGGVDSYAVLTQAGQAVAAVTYKHYPGRSVVVLCGPGNNGGDGYVAAQWLLERGHDVHVYALTDPAQARGDAARACKAWQGQISDWSELTAIDPDSVVIDAVFGAGFSGRLDTDVVRVFDIVRETGCPVVAVDVPTGLHGDGAVADPDTLTASHTVAFFKKKLPHVLMPGLALCGEVSVHDIGVPPTVLPQTGFCALENHPNLWSPLLPWPPACDAHKYQRGHILMVAGGVMSGAIRMAAQAAMRSGAGLCTVLCPEGVSPLIQADLPHVIVRTGTDRQSVAEIMKSAKVNAVLLGPGLGRTDDVREIVLDVVKSGRSVVLDADALTAFEDDPAPLFDALHAQCVLTPHAGEFERLFGKMRGNRMEQAMEAAQISGAAIVLKGPDTIIAAPDERLPVINTHASPWLATAGAGDVLAGMIAALAGQGVDAVAAAAIAVWIHGEAALRQGAGLVAPDIPAMIPGIIGDLT